MADTPRLPSSLDDQLDALGPFIAGGLQKSTAPVLDRIQRAAGGLSAMQQVGLDAQTRDVLPTGLGSMVWVEEASKKYGGITQRIFILMDGGDKLGFLTVNFSDASADPSPEKIEFFSERGGRQRIESHAQMTRALIGAVQNVVAKKLAIPLASIIPL